MAYIFKITHQYKAKAKGKDVSFLTLIFYVVFGVIALILFIGLLLPKSAKISREIIIQASQERVFKLVSEHKEFHKWSPWTAIDPNMKTGFSGPDVGVGSKVEWASENRKVGHGSSTYIAYEPNRLATVAVNLRPWRW